MAQEFPTSRVWWIRLPWRPALSLVTVLVAGVAAGCWYLSWAEERDYQAALAEADSLDPGWRLEEIEKGRKRIPDEENSAALVLKVSYALRSAGSVSFKGDDAIGALPMNVQLNPDQSATLREYLESQADALTLARRLKDMPSGSYPRMYDPSTMVFSVQPQHMRGSEVVHLLWLDAHLAAHDEDIARASDVCRASLNIARSNGDEPNLRAQLIRIAVVEVALASLERVLGKTTVPPHALATIQDAIQRELDDPRLLWAMRGERAIGVNMLDAMAQGRLQRSAFAARWTGMPSTDWRTWLSDWMPGAVSLNRANFVRAANEMVEASKLPVEQQLDAIKRVVEKRQRHDAITGTTLPACVKTAFAHTRNQARLRCFLTALAAERHRQDKGDWPASLEHLVPAGLLTAVPVDPFDAQPLRFKRVADGALFYSVGVDRTDNGGVISPHSITPGTDLGLKLWDPEWRGRPQAVDEAH
jgi:hypothetical protein